MERLRSIEKEERQNKTYRGRKPVTKSGRRGEVGRESWRMERGRENKCEIQTQSV